MKYYKVRTGYAADDFIKIDETELEISLYAFLTESKVMLNRGAVNGKTILGIKPDYHAALGLNDGHQLQPEDWERIRANCGSYETFFEETKSRLQAKLKLEIGGTQNNLSLN